MPPLRQLKKELERCKHDLLLYQHLLEKRESELNKIHALKESVQAKLMRMHHTSKINQKKSESLKHQIAEESEQITAHKKLITTIDNELDQLGEEKEEVFEELKKELIQTIQEKHPESIEEYQTTERRLKTSQQLQKQLLEQKRLILPFFEQLKEGSQINLDWGILDFLSGKNPKAQLGRSMQKAATLAEALVEKVSNNSIKKFLENFIYETKKTWNKELYQGRFGEFFEKFSILMTEQNQEIHQNAQTILNLEKTLESWIEKYTQ